LPGELCIFEPESFAFILKPGELGIARVQRKLKLLDPTLKLIQSILSPCPPLGLMFRIACHFVTLSYLRKDDSSRFNQC
jgi:hypothetical protein